METIKKQIIPVARRGRLCFPTGVILYYEL